jgi:hypothetical protein
MSNREELLTPVGRLVQGSLYDGNTTDAEGKPLTVRTGVNAGQTRTEYYFALAIPKGSEKHWSETAWGQKIWNVGHKGFPQGQASSPTFAWKIIDGDSTAPNRVGRKPCDREGYPGHWVLNFASGFAPGIYNEDGTKQISESHFVNLGDYIQVYGSVADNGSMQQPGVYLNHQMVAFRAYGERIILGADPKAVGFGSAPIPTGGSSTPPAGRFNPTTTYASAPVPMAAPPVNVAPAATGAPAAATPPPPYPSILTPAQAPARVMLPAANGATYEQMIQAGWTDQLLIQHGMMQA